MRALVTVAFSIVVVSTVFAESLPVYFGTYTGGENSSKGIYRSVLNLETGELSDPILAAEADTRTGGKVSGHYTATIYNGPKGNLVFNAATIWWAQGLSPPPGHMLPSSRNAKPKGPDPRVQRMTMNLLKRITG